MDRRDRKGCVVVCGEKLSEEEDVLGWRLWFGNNVK